MWNRIRTDCDFSFIGLSLIAQRRVCDHLAASGLEFYNQLVSSSVKFVAKQVLHQKPPCDCKSSAAVTRGLHERPRTCLQTLTELQVGVFHAKGGCSKLLATKETASNFPVRHCIRVWCAYFSQIVANQSPGPCDWGHAINNTELSWAARLW